MPPLSRFWCCLPDSDQLVLAGCLSFFVTLTGYVPKVFFDGLWSTLVTTTVPQRRELFLWEFRLTLGEVDLGDGEIIEVYFFDFEFWPALALYALDPGLTCAAPCLYRTFPA